MSDHAKYVVKKHYKRVSERITQWQAHIDETRQLTEDILDGKVNSWPEMLRRILTNSISCYDRAYGWMYPDNPDAGSPERKP